MEYLEFKGNISRLTYLKELFQRLLFVLYFFLAYSLTVAFIGIFNNAVWDEFISGDEWDNPLFAGYLIIQFILDIIPLQIARAKNIGILPFYVILYLFLYFTCYLLNAFDNEPILFIFNLILLSFEVSLFIFPGMGNKEEEQDNDVWDDND